MTGSTDIHFWQSSVQFGLTGEELVATGTIGGDNASVQINDAIMAVNMKAVRSACIGSLNEATSCRIENATFRETTGGEKALPFGGFNGNTKVALINADTSIKMETSADVEKYISTEHIEISGGRASFSNFDRELELK